MPVKGGRFTLQEQRFVEAMARTGDPAAAAHLAAYKSKNSAAQLMDRPAVQAAIREREIAVLNNELLPLANGVLRQALTDAAVPWGAKIKAVDIVHKRAFADQEGGSGKAPSEMTPDELAAALDKLKRELSERATPIIEATAVEDDIPKTNVFA